MTGPHRDPREVIREEPIMRRRILDGVSERAADGPRDRGGDRRALRTRHSCG